MDSKRYLQEEKIHSKIVSLKLILAPEAVNDLLSLAKWNNIKIWAINQNKPFSAGIIPSIHLLVGRSSFHANSKWLFHLLGPMQADFIQLTIDFLSMIATDPQKITWNSNISIFSPHIKTYVQRQHVMIIWIPKTTKKKKLKSWKFEWVTLWKLNSINNRKYQF